MDRAPRESEAAPLEPAGRHDWIWAVGLLAGLAGLSWAFDLALHLF